MKSELKAANQQQALGIAILLLVLIISPIIIFLVRYGVRKISRLLLSTGLYCHGTSSDNKRRMSKH